MTHEPYLTAVADALRNAGHIVIDVEAHPDALRAGAIELAVGHQPGLTSTTALVWHEEEGWALAAAGDDGLIRWAWPLGCDVLAEPAAVAAGLRALLAGDLTRGRLRTLPTLRDAAADDDGFEERLAAFA